MAQSKPVTLAEARASRSSPKPADIDVVLVQEGKASARLQKSKPA